MDEEVKTTLTDKLSQTKIPYGYVYKSTNLLNGKIYIGKAKEGRRGRGGSAIEKRWNEEIERAHRLKRWNVEHPHKKKTIRYIENAINKYGEESFRIEEIDIALTKEELNEKERFWIEFFDARNHSKGYNLRDGGEGGGHHEKTIALLSKISQEKAKNPEYLKKLSISITNLWNDESYLKKQIEERRARAKGPKWSRKMTQINREKAKDPKWRKKLSKFGMDKWKQQDYIEKQLISRERKRKVIENKEEFLKDILTMQKIDIDAKYDLSGKTTNRHIQHFLGHRGVTNFTQARDYLKNKNLDEILKDVESNKEKQLKQKIERRENLGDRKQFLKDLIKMQKKDIDAKYGISSKTTNSYIRRLLGHLGIMNYSQARDYLKRKSLDDVLKETK
jgi:hypothetical protein